MELTVRLYEVASLGTMQRSVQLCGAQADIRDVAATCAVFGFFFFQAEDGIRDLTVTGVQTCALPIYLEGDDPALTVGKHAEWQDRIHSERADGIQALLLADQHRIVDTDVVCVLEDRVAEVHGDPDHLQGLRRAFPPQALEQGNLLAARLAPGGPEVHQQRTALPVRELVTDAIAVGERDLRQPLGYRAPRRSHLRLGG